MPNVPKTPTRTFRCPDDLWQATKRKAEREGLTITDVLLAALNAFVDIDEEDDENDLT